MSSSFARPCVERPSEPIHRPSFGNLQRMNDRHDKDAPLAEDIRLLGRLLGDTIRAYEGAPTFERIEEIRRLAVASRRLEDTASRETLSRTLDGLTSEEAMAVVRAFSYFSVH